MLDYIWLVWAALQLLEGAVILLICCRVGMGPGQVMEMVVRGFKSFFGTGN